MVLRKLALSRTVVKSAFHNAIYSPTVSFRFIHPAFAVQLQYRHRTALCASPSSQHGHLKHVRGTQRQGRSTRCFGLPLAPPGSDDESEKRIYCTAFSLVQLQSKFGNRKVFTRVILQQIKNNKLAIFSEVQMFPQLRKISYVYHTTPAGSYGLFSHVEDYDPADSYDCVTVRSMSRIELHPDFQRHFWEILYDEPPSASN